MLTRKEANEWLLFKVTVGIFENSDRSEHSYYVAALDAEHACRLTRDWVVLIQSETTDIIALEMVSSLLLHPLYGVDDGWISP